MFLYHGSITPNLTILEPKKRYTPGTLGKNIPTAVYAGDDPVYCIGHAIPWSSSEGFDLVYNDAGICVFTVPKDKKELLNQKVYLYTLSAKDFRLLPDVSPIGHNFWTHKKVKVLKVEEFENVFVAYKKFNGLIKYI
jgi:hypothetical protein